MLFRGVRDVLRKITELSVRSCSFVLFEAKRKLLLQGLYVLLFALKTTGKKKIIIKKKN